MGGWMVVVVVVGFAINSFGLQSGLERVTKVMMLALLAIMVILAVNSILTEGAGEGLKFYLIPDLNRMQEAGIVNVIVGAMNQSFFTLSLGIGAMAIFGSFTLVRAAPCWAKRSMWQSWIHLLRSLRV